MTRDEFIDGYMQRSELSVSTRTEDGFKLGDHARVAVPCDCGDNICDGWKMINPEWLLDAQYKEPCG